jgi:hypothetical protein
MEPRHADAHPPPEIARMVARLGATKAGLDTVTLIALSVLAGAFIALGSALFLVAVSDSALGWGPTRLLGGVAFTLGLVLVVVGGAELFTGNNLLAMAWASGFVGTRAVLRNWGVVYLGNAVGALGTVVLVLWADTASLGGGAFGAGRRGRLQPRPGWARGGVRSAAACRPRPVAPRLTRRRGPAAVTHAEAQHPVGHRDAVDRHLDQRRREGVEQLDPAEPREVDRRRPRFALLGRLDVVQHDDALAGVAAVAHPLRPRRGQQAQPEDGAVRKPERVEVEVEAAQAAVAPVGWTCRRTPSRMRQRRWTAPGTRSRGSSRRRRRRARRPPARRTAASARAGPRRPYAASRTRCDRARASAVQAAKAAASSTRSARVTRSIAPRWARRGSFRG